MAQKPPIDRDTLYDEVWRIPMITLGEEKYGVSRPTIRRACIQMGVPRPPQTYWAHRAAGLKTDKPPLPPRGRNEPQTISHAELLKQEPKRRGTPEQVRKRQEKARRLLEESIRYGALIEEVDGWHRAESIRRYFSELDRRIAAGGTPTEGYAEWRRWAEAVADELDTTGLRVEDRVRR